MRWERWNICGGAVFFIETNRGRPFIPERSGGVGEWLAKTGRAGRDFLSKGGSKNSWMENERFCCLSLSFLLEKSVWALSASAETASLLCFPPGVMSRSHGHGLLSAHACSSAVRTERREQQERQDVPFTSSQTDSDWPFPAWHQGNFRSHCILRLCPTIDPEMNCHNKASSQESHDKMGRSKTSCDLISALSERW